jgi:predicted secreted protein
MATAAKSAQGTLFKANNTTQTLIPEVIRGDTPGIRSETIDVTNHDSPSGVREKIAGFKDTDNVTLEGNYISGNAMHEFLQAQQLAGTSVVFQTTIPGITGNRVCTFTAVIETFKITANVGEQLRYTMVLAPSGAPAWGPAS